MKNRNTSKMNKIPVRAIVNTVFRIVALLCIYIMYSRIIPFGTTGVLYALTGGIMGISIPAVCISLLVTGVPVTTYYWDEIKNNRLLIIFNTLFVFGIGAIAGWLYGFMPDTVAWTFPIGFALVCWLFRAIGTQELLPIGNMPVQEDTLDCNENS